MTQERDIFGEKLYRSRLEIRDDDDIYEVYDSLQRVRAAVLLRNVNISIYKAQCASRVRVDGATRRWPRAL